MKMITVETPKSSSDALNPRTAMIYLMADSGGPQGRCRSRPWRKIAQAQEHPDPG